jgi:DNA polymerase-3 subunit gamma/tau
VRLEIVPGVPGDSPARREAETAARRQREAEAIIHDDPLVQAMLAQFSTARIVPGSIRPA